MEEGCSLIDVMAALESERRGVTVRKLFQGTNLWDCEDALWDFLGLDKTAMRALPNYRVISRVCELPHQVWFCEIGKHSARRSRCYGKTFEEAVGRAFGLWK